MMEELPSVSHHLEKRDSQQETTIQKSHYSLRYAQCIHNTSSCTLGMTTAKDLHIPHHLIESTQWNVYFVQILIKSTKFTYRNYTRSNEALTMVYYMVKNKGSDDMRV